jgi:hypothetical protein
VFNPGPGGGYSNAVLFTIDAPKVLGAQSNRNTTNDTSSGSLYQPDESAPETGKAEVDGDGQSLASAAILGTGSFLPSGLVQWILFAILILIIVILVRKISGAREKYDAAPMHYA